MYIEEVLEFIEFRCLNKYFVNNKIPWETFLLNLTSLRKPLEYLINIQ